MPYQDGQRYVVTHERRIDPDGPRPDALSDFGGSTRVEIVHNELTSVLAVGVAECSRHDRFNRRRGVEIARGRAFKNLRLGIPPCPEACTGWYKPRVGIIHDGDVEKCPVHGSVRSEPSAIGSPVH